MKKIVIGMGFGDEGKGITVARLVAQNDVPWVVRFNGGCQAAHNVITDDGREHTFAQFGSGSFSGAKTFLSRFVMVEPFSLANEAAGLKTVGVDDPYSMMFIDAEALLTTPYHWLVNQHLEAQNRHGSCGRGVGQTAAYAVGSPHLAPRVGDLRNPRELHAKLATMRNRYEQLYPTLELPSSMKVTQDYEGFHNLNIIEDGRAFMKETVLAGDVVFEGAQGVLLDEWYGFHPHTTWSTTTAENATTMLHEAETYDYDVVGVLRTYHTRHGHGPFPSQMAKSLHVEAHNAHGEWQGNWRDGYFDKVLFRYAMRVAQPDELIITHWDRSDKTSMVENYVINGTPLRELPLAPVPNLKWQEGLTEMMKYAACQYAKNSWSSIPAEFENLPVRMVGTGPRIGDCILQESLTEESVLA